MRILISDRDRLTAQLIAGRLKEAGHEVVEESVKNAAIEKVQGQGLDIAFFDPAPLTNARPFVLGLRRSVSSYSYIVMLTHQEGDAPLFAEQGANSVLAKPLDVEALDAKLEDAGRLLGIVNWIDDVDQDYPSAGGVIAKSAFKQLFLSALDRADRYNEPSYLLTIKIDNIAQIKRDSGPQMSDFVASKLAHHLVRLRRQSDIIGQIGESEYSLLLQRPQNDQEPIDAANRFAASLSELEDMAGNSSDTIRLCVELVSLPAGSLSVSHQINITGNGTAHQG